MIKRAVVERRRRKEGSGAGHGNMKRRSDWLQLDACP